MAAAESNVPATNQVVVESNDTEDDGITLMDLFRIVHKHLLVGIITFVVVFAAVCAYTFLAPPKYSATAQVFATYSDSSVQDNNISNINSASTYITNQIQSYPTLATTESVLKPVIDDLGLDTTVANLAGQLTVTNPTNTAFVNITAETGDAKQASDIANSVAESLSNVVEKSLYASGKESPVKLSVVQRAAEPISPQLPEGGIVLGRRLGGRPDSRRVRYPDPRSYGNPRGGSQRSARHYQRADHGSHPHRRKPAEQQADHRVEPGRPYR